MCIPKTENVHADVTRAVLSAACAGHNDVDPGFLETIYQEALLHELRLHHLRDAPVRVILYHFRPVPRRACQAHTIEQANLMVSV